MSSNVSEFITLFENQNKGMKVGAMYDMDKWWLVAAHKVNQFDADFETPLYAIDKQTKQVATFTPTEYLDMYEQALKKQVYSE